MFKKIISNSVYHFYSNKAISRCFTTSRTHFLKEITETKLDKKLVIEGKIIPSPWEHITLKSTAKCDSACPVCSTNLDIKHTDVLILSQFLRSDGCMLPRRVTGLCKLQQKRIASMVAMAQKAGLMANIAPANSKQNPKLRKDWKKHNTYFDESTIKPPKEYRKSVPKLKLV